MLRTKSLLYLFASHN